MMIVMCAQQIVEVDISLSYSYIVIIIDIRIIATDGDARVIFFCLSSVVRYVNVNVHSPE